MITKFGCFFFVILRYAVMILEPILDGEEGRAVDAVMSGQIAGTCKPFFTNLTSKGFLSGVSALMFRQIAELCKPFVTDFAHKWFLSGVGALMSRQTTRFCETFVTDFAHKWFS